MKNGRIVFTRHALLKLEQRRIPKRAIVATLSAPDKLTYDSAAEKFFAFRKFGGRYLKVVFVRERSLIIVLTQHFVHKIP